MARPPAVRGLLALVLSCTAALGGLLGLFRLRRSRGRRGTTDGMAVVADDGTRLHVEVDEVEGSPLTVVLVHGFTARLEEFDRQREALRGRYRVVLYDQRGHGRSALGDLRHATIDQLGRDLSAVLERHAPGPVVLLGHSMGGMTVMAYARQHPEAFGTRVRGAFLLATAADDLVDGLTGLTVRLGRRLGLLPVWLWSLRLVAPVLQRLRRPGTRLGRAAVRYLLFGRDDADPATVREVQDLLEQAPFTVSAAFYPTLLSNDETAALPVLRAVPVTVLCGDSDRLTPVVHSRRMAEVIGPDCELVVVPGAGHSVNITRQQVVDDALLRLLERAVARRAA